jgi:hypothetical protein
MKSLLLSQLLRLARDQSAQAFEQAFPHDWLLWEPGAWRPTERTTVVVSARELQGAGAGEALALALREKDAQSGQIALGRGGNAQLVVNDGTLSQIHLVFSRGPTGWLVRDAASTNGSWLESARLQPGVPYPLRSGDQLTAGQVCLSFYSTAALFERVLQQPVPRQAAR